MDGKHGLESSIDNFSIRIFKIFERSKTTRELRIYKIRSIPIFKIFERCYLEFIEDHEWIKNLLKFF